MSDREFDVVVFGATGVTGRRVARYLAERADEVGRTWAAAGRDAAKVERVLAEEGVSAPEVIVADLGDPGSLAAMAQRANVVLHLAGPYTLNGRPVIEACVEAGAHYADLTGEIQFVRRVQAQFDDPASDAGVKLVEVCGFEALPPDLAVQLAAEAAAERWQEGLTAVDLEVSIVQMPTPPRPSDFISGGTFQSLATAAGDPDAAVITDPACLVDDPGFADQVRRLSPIKLAPRRGATGAVLGPMTPAAFINPAVIHRSAALRAARAGSVETPFAYREGATMEGPGVTLPLRYAVAGMLSGTQAAVGRLARARPAVRERVSRLLTRALPSSGAGPAADRLEAWRWRMDIRARTEGGNEVHVEIDADGQPGYLTTARMIGETGLMLAEPGATPEGAGCLTPAAALGTAGIDRFDRAGLRFTRPG